MEADEPTLCIGAVDSGGVNKFKFIFGLLLEDFSSPALSKTVGSLFSWLFSLVTGSPIIIPMSSESTEADLLFKGSIPSSEPQLSRLSKKSSELTAEPD